MADKELVVLHGEIKTPPFSDAARVYCGYLIRKLQQGETLSMPDSRSMPDVSPRCHELRINDNRVSWRIVYRIDLDAIIVAEVFRKQTRETPKHIIDRCKARFADYDAAQVTKVDEKKREKLAAKGWVTTTVEEFLGLAPEEIALINLKIYLGRELRRLRKEKHLTQTSLAEMIGSSQSRIAKMEAGHPGVSMDLLFRALIYLGMEPRDVAEVIDSFEPADYDGPKTTELVGEASEGERKYQGWLRAARSDLKLIDT